MKVSNENNIDIEICKSPTLIEDCNGKHRGNDSIVISIANAKEYDGDLMPDGKTVVINLSNDDALSLIQQLATCIGKNVDDEFIRQFPGVAPF